MFLDIKRAEIVLFLGVHRKSYIERPTGVKNSRKIQPRNLKLSVYKIIFFSAHEISLTLGDRCKFLSYAQTPFQCSSFKTFFVMIWAPAAIFSHYAQPKKNL